MSVKGIIMFLGMNNTRLERKIRIVLDFENGFLPTYLPHSPGGDLHVDATMLRKLRGFIEKSS